MKKVFPLACLTGGILLMVLAIGQGPPPPPPPPPPAVPLADLTSAEQQAFNAGYNQFIAIENPQTGLGPVFNGTTCVQCHRAGGAGGASLDRQVSLVTRFAGLVNGQYSDIENLGGQLVQRRSLREFMPNYPVPGEVVPAQAQFVSRRITTPVFGDGLIDSIADKTILARVGMSDPDGVAGRPNYVMNPATGALELGKFGWKAQVSSLRTFTADALLNEEGITSHLFPTEVLPQGQPIPPGADPTSDPEDNDVRVNRMHDYMRFTAGPRSTIANTYGEALFAKIRCTSCHVASMRTKLVASSPVLSNKLVPLYSDLLVHSMGQGLADGVRQGQAAGDQWRTAPLWGLSQRPFLLHDGRATTVEQAILAHGGEAQRARDRYAALSFSNKQALLQFLGGL